jgi:hypothetical protein
LALLIAFTGFGAPILFATSSFTRFSATVVIVFILSVETRHGFG